MSPRPATLDSDELPVELQMLSGIVRKTLAELPGVSDELAASMGEGIALEFAEECGSVQFYFPKALLARLSQRDREIYAQFNGHNYAELARLHKMSDRHVRRLVKRAKALITNTTQGDMFGDRAVPNRR